MKQVYCNKCGKLMDDADVYQNFHIRDTLGYGSRYDEGHLDLRLCNACLDRLIESCKISPVRDEVPLPVVILISGKAGSGKDTAAGYLEEFLHVYCTYKVGIIHFADLLKYIIETYYQWDCEKDRLGRHMMQELGTDVVRKQKPNYWVDFVADLLGFLRGRWQYVIIPDTRFPNEISRLRERGYDPIHLRITCKKPRAELTYEQANHISECALDDVEPDYTISNDGSLNELRDKMRQWAEEVLYA